MRIKHIDWDAQMSRGTVGYSVKDYLSMRWAQLAPATKRVYARAADTILKHFAAEPMDTFSPEDVLLITGISNGIRSQVMNLAAASANWAMKRRHVKSIAVWKRCGVPNKGEWEAWTPRDVQAAAEIRDYDPVMRDIILFAAYTGMRRTDILSISPANFYLQSAKVHLVYTQSKTGAVIDMPLADPIQDLDMIKRAMRGDDPFLRQVKSSNFYRKYLLFSRRIGIVKPFHGLRKHCATMLAEAGCSMPEIMSITGHESPNTCMRYIKSANKKKLSANAIAKIGLS